MKWTERHKQNYNFSKVWLTDSLKVNLYLPNQVNGYTYSQQIR